MSGCSVGVAAPCSSRCHQLAAEGGAFSVAWKRSRTVPAAATCFPRAVAVRCSVPAAFLPLVSPVSSHTSRGVVASFRGGGSRSNRACPVSPFAEPRSPVPRGVCSGPQCGLPEGRKVSSCEGASACPRPHARRVARSRPAVPECLATLRLRRRQCLQPARGRHPAGGRVRGSASGPQGAGEEGRVEKEPRGASPADRAKPGGTGTSGRPGGFRTANRQESRTIVNPCGSTT